MGRQKARQLLLQAAAHDLRLGGQIDSAAFAAGDLHQPPLEPVQGVLQAEVHDLALPDGEAPDGLPRGDTMGQPQRQPGLADLGLPAEQGQPSGDQLIHHEDRLGELHVHDLIRGNEFQLRDLQPEHPGQVPEDLRLLLLLHRHGVVHHVAPPLAAGEAVAVPGAVVVGRGLFAAVGAADQRPRVVRDLLPVEVVNQSRPQLVPQPCHRLFVDNTYLLLSIVRLVFFFRSSDSAPG